MGGEGLNFNNFTNMGYSFDVISLQVLTKKKTKTSSCYRKNQVLSLQENSHIFRQTKISSIQ